jgi:hypothetical protein
MSRAAEQGLSLGSWVFPSGNTCEAVLRIDDGRPYILFAWDDPPPLVPEDEEFYRCVVIPEVTQRALALMRMEMGDVAR